MVRAARIHRQTRSTRATHLQWWNTRSPTPFIIVCVGGRVSCSYRGRLARARRRGANGVGHRREGNVAPVTHHRGFSDHVPATACPRLPCSRWSESWKNCVGAKDLHQQILNPSFLCHTTGLCRLDSTTFKHNTYYCTQPKSGDGLHIWVSSVGQVDYKKAKNVKLGKLMSEYGT
jgi:hypothetical protein